MSTASLDHDDRDLADEARRGLQAALYETKRVIVGQDAMLERVFVAPAGRRARPARGRARPGQDADRPHARAGARRLASRACSSRPTSCRPTSSARGSGAPTTATSGTELGPVFANLLLADEINRAPAKVQSALLEVMQEQQVTIGGTAYAVPQPFLVLATQNPIESEGTYAAARGAGRPLPVQAASSTTRRSTTRSACSTCSTARRSCRARSCSVDSLLDHRRAARAVYVDRSVKQFAVQVVDATRHPARHGLPEPGAAHRVRRQPARVDRAHAGRAGARAAARPRARDDRRRARPRRRRPAPPADPLLRRARRRRLARRAHRPRGREGRRPRGRAGGRAGGAAA